MKMDNKLVFSSFSSSSLPSPLRGSGCFVYVFAVALLVNGLSNSICGAAATFPVLLIYVVIFGLSMSVIGSLLFTVLMETVEMSRFPSALGLISMLESGTLLIGPPLAGTVCIAPVTIVLLHIFPWDKDKHFQFYS